MKASMLTYRVAETAQISELNTDRQSVRNHSNTTSSSAKHTEGCKCQKDSSRLSGDER